MRTFAYNEPSYIERRLEMAASSSSRRIASSLRARRLLAAMAKLFRRS
jgi:hypothetical protein